MKRALVVVLIAAAFGAGVGFDRWRAREAEHAGHKEHGKAEEAKGKRYYCPMHPNIRQDKPGECPICGMKLVPEMESEAPAAGPATMAESEEMPAGTFRVSPEKQQLIGVQYGEARLDSVSEGIRAVGRVAPDERRISQVQTRVEGWVDKLYVDFTGKLVEKGEPLLTVYSPELLATQQEYLLALRSREVLNNISIDGLRQDSNGLVEAARRRMEHWGLGEEQVRQLEANQKPLTNITIHSPVSGYVTEKKVFPKSRITPEMPLYTITDLSRVWVMADVFEDDAAAVRMGQRATVTATAYPGRRWAARVAFIQPQVSAESRTLQVRLELENPGLLLKPEMYVDVDLAGLTQTRLTVPVDAVVNSGLRQTVFVDKGNGFLEPRQVEVGDSFDGRVEIRSGLKAGERIVTSGTFLIDSESQLRNTAAGGGAGSGGAAPAGEHKHD